MTEIKTSRLLNDSKSGNFVFEPVDNICNVQIFDAIEMETCGEVIGRLTQVANQLPIKTLIDSASITIETPYDIPADRFVFDVTINSRGGDVDVCRCITNIFALAKSRGAIVRTNNIGQAASSASMIAIMGTPGYRIMAADACNFIHYGKTSLTACREGEMEVAAENSKRNREIFFAAYEKYTKLTPAELKKFKKVEGAGKLFAEECLAKHVCDWILTSDGRFIGRGR